MTIQNLIHNPDANTRKNIELIIQATRMNQLVWEKPSEETLETVAELRFKGSSKIFENVKLMQLSGRTAFDAEIRYSLKIGDSEISSLYGPVNMLGKYLFCEDYKK
jgi:hypothetical protein